jgi:N-acetylmuramoyl-L-alanine amidase
LVSIARRYGVALEQLMAANHLLAKNRIFPGQKLNIPGVAAPAEMEASAKPIELATASESSALASVAIDTGEPSRQHVVRKGETLARIAKRYSISVDALRSRNDLASSTIHPGQVLAIP